MTAGVIHTGGRGPYQSHVDKIWSGVDDPQTKSAWNDYSVSAITQINKPSHRGYTLGIDSDAELVFSADDQLRLLDKLASEIRGHEFNAGVFLGQSHQLTNQIVNTARGFVKTASYLKRFDLPGALRTLGRSVGADARNNAKRKLSTKDIAGAHLSLVYGWLPAVSDVFAAAKAFEVLSSPPRQMIVTVARARSSVIESSQSPSNYTCPKTLRVSKRITCILTEEISSQRSLGLTDPLSVAWELVPWSFVADWFVPIGTYLDVLGQIPFLQGEFRIQERSWASVPGCNILAPQAPPYDFYKGADSSSRSMRYTRSKTSALDVPLPTFRGFEQLTGNATRIANAAALIRQLYSHDWVLLPRPPR